MKTYNIKRMFFNGELEMIKTGLTLKQARTHCQNPETNSKTATSPAALKLTIERGQWFDGYGVEYNPAKSLPSGVWDCALNSEDEIRLQWASGAFPEKSRKELEKLATLRWFQLKDTERETLKKYIELTVELTRSKIELN